MIPHLNARPRRNAVNPVAGNLRAGCMVDVDAMLLNRAEPHIMDAVIADHDTGDRVAPADTQSIPTARQRDRRVHEHIGMLQRDIAGLDIEAVGHLRPATDRPLTQRRPTIAPLIQIKGQIRQRRTRPRHIRITIDRRPLTRIGRNRHPRRREVGLRARITVQATLQAPRLPRTQRINQLLDRSKWARHRPAVAVRTRRRRHPITPHRRRRRRGSRAKHGHGSEQRQRQHNTRRKGSTSKERHGCRTPRR
jgi:hypothetical protein